MDQFNKYIRKPFEVEAVQITKENIGEIAEMIGELRYKEEGGDPYIQVNRRLVPNLWRVYVGFWVTKMGDNLRCYSRKIFAEQFIQDSEFESWMDEFLEDPSIVPVPTEADPGNEADEDVVDDNIGNRLDEPVG